MPRGKTEVLRLRPHPWTILGRNRWCHCVCSVKKGSIVIKQITKIILVLGMAYMSRCLSQSSCRRRQQPANQGMCMRCCSPRLRTRQETKPFTFRPWRHRGKASGHLEAPSRPDRQDQGYMRAEKPRFLKRFLRFFVQNWTQKYHPKAHEVLRF